MRALPHVVAAFPLLALGLAACQSCRSSRSTVAASGAASPASSNTADPGPPTARLYLLTDLAGALEPCGCTKDQLGGLDHFGAWVKREHARAPNGFVAAAGPLFFMDDALAGDRADQDRIKAETISRVLHGLGFVAFAPGANDWDEGPRGLAVLATTSGATAIVEGVAPASPAFAAVVVREVGGLRVGFVGFGQPPSEGDPHGVEAAVARGADEAKRRGANVLVALAAVGRGEAKRIADAVPELTAVVVGSVKARGDGNTTAAEPEQVGDVLVVQGANHLQSVPVVDLYVREPVAPGRLVKFADGSGLERSRRLEDLSCRIDDLSAKIAAWERNPAVVRADVDARRRELEGLRRERAATVAAAPPVRGSFFRYALEDVRASLGTDTAIEAQMRDYYKVVHDRNRVALAGRLPPPLAPGQAGYVGVEACGKCHAAARAFWNGTAHAHAYETLSSQYKELDLECVGCHVTGYERPGGSTVTHVDGLRDVQCEVCHGPGSKHVEDPLDTASIVAKPPPSTCLQCHHSPHVEGFDPAAKTKEILGPGHGMPVKTKTADGG